MNTVPDAETNEADEGPAVRQVTGVGLLVNLGLCAVKFTAGIVGGSQAVVADAVHSLSDSATDVAILVGSHFWTRPADAEHPYGHRRIETLVTLLVGFALLAAGVGLGWHAIATFRHEHARAPGWIAFWAGVVSIVGKETLYRWTVAVGRRVRSLALQANAWHHRSDAFSSIPTVFAVAGAALYPEWRFLDHLGALVVSGFILHAAYVVLWPRFAELAESGAPSRLRRRILEIARDVEGVEDVHALRSRYVSSYLHVDLHVLVAPEMPVRHAHEIATQVSRRIVKGAPGVFDVVVHIEPDESGAREQNGGGQG